MTVSYILKFTRAGVDCHQPLDAYMGDFAITLWLISRTFLIDYYTYVDV